MRMKKEIYLAAATGDDRFLEEARAIDVEAAVAEYSDDDFRGLTSHGNNIIHVAAQHDHLDFINKALERIPKLKTEDIICGTNKDGDTPLHLAAKLDTSAVAEHLVQKVAPCSCPWSIQNNRGNSPLHLALMNGGKSIQAAAYLLRVGPQVASYVNHRDQTPLHLAVHYDNQGAKISMKKLVNKLNGLGAALDYTESLFEEDSLSLIEELLKTNTEVCCLRDKDGMTPLLRAALKSYVRAVEVIIDYCPECVEICDTRGKNVLHHLNLPSFQQAKKIMKKLPVSMMDQQDDEEGNTPLHMAIKNYNYNMVKAMFYCKANFGIQNNEGASPATLIESESSSAFLDKTMDYIKRFNNIIKDEVDVPMELFEAVSRKEWRELLGRLDEADTEKQFLSRLPNGSNIFHVATEDYDSALRDELIAKAAKKYPILLCQTDFAGRTPLHTSISTYSSWKTMLDVLKVVKDQSSGLPLPPWEAKDSNGDTLLHLAFKHGIKEWAMFLIEIADAKLVGETNNSRETPLHCLCRADYSLSEKYETEIFGLLTEKDASMVHSYDADGFTPLLRAVQQRDTLNIAKRIIERYPETASQVDSQFGRNLFHLLPDLDPMFKDYPDFIEVYTPQKFKLFLQGDSHGDTPLHFAVKQHHFGTAQLLIQRGTPFIYRRNYDGKTWIDLLGTAEDVPREFEEFLSSELSDDQRGLSWVGKSLYGVHYSKMKDFMGMLGVVAALLATITFTAAFTVPGGFDQGKGTPLLAKQVAFQVFMFADVIGMCSSIMALSCLIWFFTSNDIEEGSTLGDLSMGLLRLSFYATLVAFMTGVYVVLSPQAQTRWLAIFTCVICGLVLLLTKKHLMMNYLANVFYSLSTFVNRLRTGIGYLFSEIQRPR